MENFDVLNEKLSTDLKDTSFNFILNNFKADEGVDTSLMINLFLSSHLSSLGTCMQMACEGSNNPEIEKGVNEFWQKLVIFIKNNIPKEPVLN